MKEPAEVRNTGNVVSINSGGHRQRVQSRRDELVNAHLDLVRSIAESVKADLPPSFELDDLIGAGNAGLLQAATTYRPGKHGGVPFSAYARLRIRGAILNSVSRRHYLENTRPEITETNEPAVAPVIDISIDRERRLARIRHAMGYLEPRKRAILRKYYGDNPMTFEGISESMGLSRSHTGELHSEAISELRRILHVA